MGIVTAAAIDAQYRVPVFAPLLVIVAADTKGRELLFDERAQLSRMGFMAVRAVVRGRLVPVRCGKQRFVAVPAYNCRTRRVGVGIVALVAVRLEYGGMNDSAGPL